MQLAITPSAFNERGPLAMEQVLGAVHQGSASREPLTLSLVRTEGSVRLVCQVPDPLASLVEGQLLAQYPNARIERSVDERTAIPKGAFAWTVGLTLRREVFPIRRYPEFTDLTTRELADPLTGVFSALAGLKTDPVHLRIDLITRPAREAQVRRAQWCLAQWSRTSFARHPMVAEWFVGQALSRHWWQRVTAHLFIVLAGRLPRPDYLPAPAGRSHDREAPLQAAHDKLRKRLFEVECRLTVIAPGNMEARSLGKLQELVGTLGQVGSAEGATWQVATLQKSRRAARKSCRGFLLSAEELATLWHLPLCSLKALSVELSQYRQLEPPSCLPSPLRDKDVASLGRTAFRRRNEPFGLKTDDRRRHLYIVGKTGMGKSTLLLNLLGADIRAGRGCVLIDPHGDLAEAALAAVPSHRTNDVVVFDAGDQAYPVAFNPLADCRWSQRPLVASGMLSAFKKLYGDSWGPRLEHIFRNCLLALLEVPGSSLISLVQLLGDAHYREAIVAKVTDPVVRAFWRSEFAHMPSKLQAEAIAPIQNKVGHFVSSPLLRNILGQPRSTLDLRRIMDQEQILIVNLSKGRMGEDASSLLGALVITSLQLAAMSRAEQQEHERRDTYLYVDEFQNFATESFAAILSEARKYRLNLTLANQYLDQMDEATAHAVFGNCGSLVVFQVGERDSETLAAQLGHDVMPHDVLALPRYEAYARLLVDGLPTSPFSMRTLLPPANPEGHLRSDIIRRNSRRRYGRTVDSVTAEIARAFANG